jgi:hypothetical protein
MRFLPALATALCLSLVAPASSSAEDLSSIDLTGHWYILIHYKDDRSQDKSITKFKDVVWSIEQGENKIKITSYPYVFFSEADELIRRNNMMNHIAWKPDERIWGEIREYVRTSQRGSKVKTLRPSGDQVFESNADGGGFGMNTLTFTQNWKLTFAQEQIKVEITDSLSGSSGLAGMDETILYELQKRVAEDEFHGKYDEPTKHGKLWMVRSKQRLGQKGDPDAREAQADQRRQSAFERLMEQSTDK